jgi:hypothetical protein
MVRFQLSLEADAGAGRDRVQVFCVTQAYTTDRSNRSVMQ